MDKVEEAGSTFFGSRRSVQKLNALVFGRDARPQPEDSPGTEARCNVKQIFVKLFQAVCRNADTVPRASQVKDTQPTSLNLWLRPYCRFPLIRHDWPGNIRELQNFIERAVILSRETMLLAPVEELKSSVGLATAGPITLEQAESNHILHTLRETNWVIGGPKGAAARLGLKRTTLISKMRRLRLSRPPTEMTQCSVC